LILVAESSPFPVWSFSARIPPRCLFSSGGPLRHAFFFPYQVYPCPWAPRSSVLWVYFPWFKKHLYFPPPTALKVLRSPPPHGLFLGPRELTIPYLQGFPITVCLGRPPPASYQSLDLLIFEPPRRIGESPTTPQDYNFSPTGSFFLLAPTHVFAPLSSLVKGRPTAS